MWVYTLRHVAHKPHCAALVDDPASSEATAYIVENAARSTEVTKTNAVVPSMRRRSTLPVAAAAEAASTYEQPGAHAARAQALRLQQTRRQ